MHPLTLLKVLGLLLIVLGSAELLPMAASALYGDADWPGFLISGGGSLALGGVVYAISRRARELSIRDGFVVVTTVWISACVVGAVPFMLTRPALPLVDALFESVSGFTTTGASVLVDYAQLSHGILLWRALSQWIGGMGIIVLALAILPALGVAGMQLYQREVPGPYHDKITPRLRDTAKALWSVYVVLTAVEIVVLALLGMPVFDAICHAMSTLSTGGFGTRADSIAGYHSVAIEWAVIAFMFIGGMNFSLHYRLVAGPNRRFGHITDPEWRAYALGTLSICAAVTGYLWAVHGYSPGRALTAGTFQVVSLITTTGFASDDYVAWGAFPQLLLLFCMLVGGSAGSTSGGLKWIRLVVSLKSLHRDMLRLVHPNVVVQAKVHDVNVTARIQSHVSSYVLLFLGTIGVLALLISMDGHSPLVSLGAAASAVGNIGPGLGELGPSGNYAALSPYVKELLATGMLLGRLELMTVFMVFLPHTWRI